MMASADKTSLQSGKVAHVRPLRILPASSAMPSQDFMQIGPTSTVGAVGPSLVSPTTNLQSNLMPQTSVAQQPSVPANQMYQAVDIIENGVKKRVLLPLSPTKQQVAAPSQPAANTGQTVNIMLPTNANIIFTGPQSAASNGTQGNCAKGVNVNTPTVGVPISGANLQIINSGGNLINTSPAGSYPLVNQTAATAATFVNANGPPSFQFIHPNSVLPPNTINLNPTPSYQFVNANEATASTVSANPGASYQLVNVNGTPANTVSKTPTASYQVVNANDANANTVSTNPGASYQLVNVNGTPANNVSKTSTASYQVVNANDANANTVSTNPGASYQLVNVNGTPENNVSKIPTASYQVVNASGAPPNAMSKPPTANYQLVNVNSRTANTVNKNVANCTSLKQSANPTAKFQMVNSPTASYQTVNTGQMGPSAVNENPTVSYQVVNTNPAISFQAVCTNVAGKPSVVLIPPGQTSVSLPGKSSATAMNVIHPATQASHTGVFKTVQPVNSSTGAQDNSVSAKSVAPNLKLVQPGGFLSPNPLVKLVTVPITTSQASHVAPVSANAVKVTKTIPSTQTPPSQQSFTASVVTQPPKMISGGPPTLMIGNAPQVVPVKMVKSTGNNVNKFGNWSQAPKGIAVNVSHAPTSTIQTSVRQCKTASNTMQPKSTTLKIINPTPNVVLSQNVKCVSVTNTDGKCSALGNNADDQNKQVFIGTQVGATTVKHNTAIGQLPSVVVSKPQAPTSMISLLTPPIVSTKGVYTYNSLTKKYVLTANLKRQRTPTPPNMDSVRPTSKPIANVANQTRKLLGKPPQMHYEKSTLKIESYCSLAQFMCGSQVNVEKSNPSVTHETRGNRSRRRKPLAHKIIHLNPEVLDESSDIDDDYDDRFLRGESHQVLAAKHVVEQLKSQPTTSEDTCGLLMDVEEIDERQIADRKPRSSVDDTKLKVRFPFVKSCKSKSKSSATSKPVSLINTNVPKRSVVVSGRGKRNVVASDTSQQEKLTGTDPTVATDASGRESDLCDGGYFEDETGDANLELLLDLDGGDQAEGVIQSAAQVQPAGENKQKNKVIASNTAKVTTTESDLFTKSKKRGGRKKKTATRATERRGKQSNGNRKSNRKGRKRKKMQMDWKNLRPCSVVLERLNLGNSVSVDLRTWKHARSDASCDQIYLQQCSSDALGDAERSKEVATENISTGADSTTSSKPCKKLEAIVCRMYSKAPTEHAYARVATAQETNANLQHPNKEKSPRKPTNYKMIVQEGHACLIRETSGNPESIGESNGERNNLLTNPLKTTVDQASTEHVAPGDSQNKKREVDESMNQSSESKKARTEPPAILKITEHEQRIKYLKEALKQSEAALAKLRQNKSAK